MTRQAIEARLRSAGIDEYRTEALRLLSHFSGIGEARLRAEPLYDCDSPALEDALIRREQREPLDYILGYRVFRNETYRVTPDVLIPRWDTERLVEIAAEDLPHGARVADLCTGSGCIAVSLLAARKDLTCDAFDISESALAVARENARDNGVGDRVVFRALDLLTAGSLPHRYAAILSNPPYIRKDVLPALPPETQKEPMLALDGGDDGLLFYRRFIAVFRPYLIDGGAFYFEIGYDQGNALRALGDAAGMTVLVHRDYEDRERVAVLSLR